MRCSRLIAPLVGSDPSFSHMPRFSTTPIGCHGDDSNMIISDMRASEMDQKKTSVFAAKPVRINVVPEKMI